MSSPPTVIRFYNSNDPFGELSNSWKMDVSITFRNKLYPTSEHLYQALPFLLVDTPTNQNYAEEIRNAKTPYMSKILSKQEIDERYEWRRNLNKIINEYKRKARPCRYWDSIKVEAMRSVLHLKFHTSSHCKKVLLSTGNSEIVEESLSDKFWGIGADGNGENMLGKLLMELRKELQDNTEPRQIAKDMDKIQYDRLKAIIADRKRLREKEDGSNHKKARLTM